MVDDATHERTYSNKLGDPLLENSSCGGTRIDLGMKQKVRDEEDRSEKRDQGKIDVDLLRIGGKALTLAWRSYTDGVY